MRWFDLFEGVLNWILESLITVFFLFIFILTGLLVIMRYGFNSSIIWGSEAMNYMFIYTTALGAAVAVGKNTHIKISCFKDLAKGRMHSFISIVNYALIGGINAVLGWFSLPWIASAGSFESPVMRIPMWTVQIVVPLGCGLACLYCLMHIVRIIAVGEDKGGEAC